MVALPEATLSTLAAWNGSRAAGQGRRDRKSMVTKRPIERRKRAAFILLAVAILALSTVLAPPASADLPNLHATGAGTRAVISRMNTTDGLTLQGVDLTNGNVTLPWSVRPSVVFIRQITVLVPSPLSWRFGRSAEAGGARTVLRARIATASRMNAARFRLSMGLFVTMDFRSRLPCPAARDPFQAASVERVASGSATI